MAIEYTVKNTFLTKVKPTQEEPVRRSSSVPRAFKPSDFKVMGPISDACTTASDKDSMSSLNRSDSVASFAATCSECDSQDYSSIGGGVGWGCQDFPDYRSDCMESSSLDEKESPTDACADEKHRSRVTISLDDMVSKEVKIARAKLKSNARPFKSARTPAGEVMGVIANAVEVLSKDADISSVRVHDGGMGGTTMIVGKSSSLNPDALLVFSLVKDALLRSAEKSENTYILGYGTQPFNNLDPLSFSANIACMPKTHQDTACWDTYENGSCPRCATCRWDHPSDIDQIRVIVMIQKAGPSLVVDQRMQ